MYVSNIKSFLATPLKLKPHYQVKEQTCIFAKPKRLSTASFVQKAVYHSH